MAGRNEIEILIKARDEASAALAGVNRKIREMEGSAGPAGQALGDVEQGISGIGASSALMVAGIAAATVSLGSLFVAIQKGIKSIDDLKVAQASMAAAAVSNDPSKPWEQVYETTGRIVEKIYELDRAFVGTGEELLTLSDSMVTFGMGIDLSTKKQQDQFVAFANMIKLMTRGQDFQRQAFQEVRSLMEGVDVQGALLVKKLAAAGVNVKAMVPEWREQGVLLEKIMEILPGYAQGSKEIEKTLQAQKSSLETITFKILRAGTAQAYEDIAGLVKRINDSLMDENGLTEDAKTLVDLVAGSWDLVKTIVGGIGETLRITVLPLIREMVSLIKKSKELQAYDETGVDPFGIFSGGGRRGPSIGDISGALESFYGSDIKPEDMKLAPGGRGGDDAAVKSLEKFTDRVKELISKYQLEVKNLSETGGDEIDRIFASNHQKWSERLRSIADDKNWKAIPASMRNMLTELMSEGERFDNVIDLEKKRDAAISALRKKMAKEERDALEERLKSIGRSAEMELKGIERQEELEIRLKALRDEAETPVKWPWNENEVELMQRMSAETTRFAENIRRLNKEFDASERGEGPFMSKEQYDEAFRAYQNAYGAALAKVREETDVTTQHVADAWNELFSGLGGEISDVFFDAFKGKLDSLGDYMEAFTDVVRRAWANLIADMITEQLKLSFGDTAKGGLGSLAGLFGGGGGSAAALSEVGGMTEGLSMFYGYKDGGVLPGSFMPIRAFASGGIADRPTLGIIGEGGGSEAVIPLKGGKVPVELLGGSSKENNFNFTIVAADTRDMDRLLMDRRSLIVGMMADGMRNASPLRDSIRRSI
jgi:hypothetical protein